MLTRLWSGCSVPHRQGHEVPKIGQVQLTETLHQTFRVNGETEEEGLVNDAGPRVLSHCTAFLGSSGCCLDSPTFAESQRV